MLTREQVRAKLWQSFSKSIFSRKTIFAFVLSVTLLLTAFAVVETRYEYKLALDEEQRLFLENQTLRQQWTQISIEYSMLASASNVENFARANNMQLPNRKTLRVIEVGEPKDE